MGLGIYPPISTRHVRRVHYSEVRYYNTRRLDTEAYTIAGTGGLLELSSGLVPEPGASSGPPAGNPYQMLI